MTKTAFSKKQPLLSKADHGYFLHLLKAYRQFEPSKWRTAVRETSVDCVSRDALAALCDVVVEYEELRVTKAKEIEFSFAEFDYGQEVGTSVKARMTPLQKITLGTLLKFLAAVLREKHNAMEAAQRDTVRYKEIIERSWIRRLGDLVEPILRRFA